MNQTSHTKNNGIIAAKLYKEKNHENEINKQQDVVESILSDEY
jgi:hypothetical protein